MKNLSNPCNLITFISILLGVIDFIEELTYQPNYNKKFLWAVAMTTVALLLGAYASLKHNRNLLLSYALILVLSIVVRSIRHVLDNWDLAFGLTLVSLSISQAELVKRRFHDEIL